MSYPYDDDDTMHPDDASPWSFHDARATSSTPDDMDSSAPSRPRASTRQGPRISRHSSLPRVLFGSGSASIFGSGSARMEDEQEQEHDHDHDHEHEHEQPAERPPLLSLQPPSQEQVDGVRPALSTLPPTPKRPVKLSRTSGQADVNLTHLSEVEKEADDPTANLASSSRGTVDRQQSTTLTTLSRLFAVQSAVSPEASRHSSYLFNQHQHSYERNIHTNNIPDLPNHLYTRGLLEGKHSDITVNAFGQKYRLHRLVLDQAPFFTSALSAPWLEADAKEVTVHPEDLDASITQSSFELALKRLYGASTLQEEDGEAVGLFATACWLEMQDLIDDSIGSMLRHMTPETISPLIKLVTSNYYGRSGDKILASAKAMLCRDGWRMPMRYWDGIPGDIIREIVGGDGFFIDGEWDRWVLAKTILDRRLRLRAIEGGLVEAGRRRVRRAPDTANLMAVRFDGVYRKNGGGARGMPDALQPWIAPYTHPDVEPILVLLDEGIHYIHLDFEQLQFIRRARDILSLPVMPEKVIASALWQQMELRQKVLNADEHNMELNLSETCTDGDDGSVAGGGRRDTTMSITTPSEPPTTSGKGKSRQLEAHPDELEDEIESGSWDGNGKPRKFWIPGSDCNIVMGGRDEPVIATTNNGTLQRHATRLSATIQPEDIQWAADFAAMTSQPRPQTAGSDGINNGDSAPPLAEVRYTHFPPFRFAAEFPNPRLLKEKKRVYSRTVFYAGSLWNIYIQKVATSRNKQLGVYLHRAKERETEDLVAGGSGIGGGVGVDQRIGTLEREMVGGRGGRRRERRLRRLDGGEGEESEGSVPGDLDSAVTGAGGATESARASTMRSLLGRGAGAPRPGQKEAGQPPGTSMGAGNMPFTDSEHEHDHYDLNDSDLLSSDDPSDSEHPPLPPAPPRIPTLPPYVDARPTIKTYFKIYSPSRGGRMLSVYESAPDKFNFSQSWGWKSSTLMLDEGLLGSGGGGVGGGGSPGGVGGGTGDDEGMGVGGVDELGVKGSGRGDGRLRFMVVIGNI
ncbi:hypothetical protein LTR78_006217 [Recurvomyces mirabilis]|uniref:BTB domain-containing protein n=1 Tax=Recurvomyces mirabilis TaxID=574656 RepID=A0AAE0WLL9_9PEZI|nr:hypothetical protein LTR78_006217 [Recurvomyces mirabilis]KAK5152058.1 hypothetical protein LTS14_008833 [Recurvomyces mirabilis]